MATGVRFRMDVEGFDEAIKRLAGFDRTLKSKVIHKRLRQGGRILMEESRRNLQAMTGNRPTHRGPDYKPGALEKAFVLRARTYRNEVFVSVMGPAWLKPGGQHSHLVELGTEDRPHPITGTSGRMPAIPFMALAFAAKQVEVNAKIRAGLSRDIVDIIEGRIT